MKTGFQFRIAALLCPIVLSACASMMAAPAPAKVAGDMFTNNDGMTLYTFDRDPAGAGKSVCNGPCAANWPALMAADGAAPTGDWSVVTRDDGKKQWAYKGKPLYTWIKDKAPGDKTGDGFANNMWHVAKP